jgi:hypothetical protein
MSELRAIKDTLRRTAARRRLDRGLRGLWRGLFLAACAWLTAVAAYKLLPLPAALPLYALLLPPLGAAAGFLAGFWRRPGLAETARWVEERRQLEQRVSTALELAGRPDRADRWTSLVVQDAARALRDLDARRLLPLHLPVLARWTVLLLAALLVLGFVPEYRTAGWKKRQQETAVIRDTGRKLAEVVRRDLERRPPADEELHRETEGAAELGDRLAQARLTRADALQDLANLADRLRQEARELNDSPALQKVRQAARTPSGQTGAANSALQKQLEKMQQTLGRAASQPDALDKLARDLQRAQQAAAGMQAGNAAEAAAARQQLAQSLAQLAQQAQSLGAGLPALEAALEALNRHQPDLVLRDLQLAMNDLEKLRDMAKALAQMQAQSEQPGKNLGEQLERGQAQTAAATLEKMEKQLQEAGLTPEQLQQMLDELSQAAKPAGEYGEVAKLLEAAARQAKDGEKGEAASSLAQAAAELRKLDQQAQDAQALAETLAALDAAQMAIATGNGWKQGNCRGGRCPGCGTCGGTPGFGPGGRPGRGVGTWADEYNWMFYPEISERWDNTGIERPDMAARGHTDRGEGRLAENVAPTKLRGQFSPGGQMPSITLKGVSIQGRSSVGYTEAAEAAQSEARSALSQDQVPRAYRGAVRDYFDDLK